MNDRGIEGDGLSAVVDRCDAVWVARRMHRALADDIYAG